MALTKVRVQIDGQWHELALNNVTNRYEAYIVPTRTSFYEEGSRFNVIAEATNDTGKVLTTDGTNIPGLMLKAVETAAPDLLLVSPAQGYITTGMPDITFSATDEAGGSGVDITTLSILLDGIPVSSSNIGYIPISNGYRITYTPEETILDGKHTVFITIQDNDGNASSLKLEYIVDTVPPTLKIFELPFKVIVDKYSIMISGYVEDAVSPTVSLTIKNNDADTNHIHVLDDGTFAHDLPLNIGENYIQITATDEAGLKTNFDLYIIRLITDRSEEDIAVIEKLCKKPLEMWSQKENEWFNQANSKGAYNYTDLNRVETAMQYLQHSFLTQGTTINYIPVKAGLNNNKWERDELFTHGNSLRYLANIETVRQQLPEKEDIPETPSDMNDFLFDEANDIEKILVMADDFLYRLYKSSWYCGEVVCGEN